MKDILEKIWFPFNSSYWCAIYQCTILAIIAFPIGLFLTFKYNFPDYTANLLWIIMLVSYAYYLYKKL